MTQKGYEIVNQVLISPLEFNMDVSESKTIHFGDVKIKELSKHIKDTIVRIQKKIEEVKKQVKIIKKTEEPLKRIQLLRRIKDRTEYLTVFFESCFDKEFDNNLMAIQNATDTVTTKYDVEGLKQSLNVIIFEVNDETINVSNMFVGIVSDIKNYYYSKQLEAGFQKIRDEVIKKEALTHLEFIKSNEKKLSTIENPVNLLFTLEGNVLLNDITSIEESRIAIKELIKHDLKIFKRPKIYGYTLIVSQLLLVLMLLIILQFNSSVNLFDSSYKEGIHLIGIPITLILWSYLGCVSSLFFRVKNYRESNLSDIIRLIMVRPIQSIIITSLLFLVFKSGISIFSTNSTTIIMKSNDIISLIAFFIGFSNKFTEKLLTKMYSLIGGEINDKQHIDKNEI